MGERPYGRTTRGSRAVTIESLRFHAQSTTLAPLPPVTIPLTSQGRMGVCEDVLDAFERISGSVHSGCH